MGKSMYQYGKQTKGKDRQLKQIAKQLKRSSVKQQQMVLSVLFSKAHCLAVKFFESCIVIN